YDIPIALVTEQYLGTLDLMKSLNLDVAGEFLLMAATLAQIKSRMLLPPSENEEEDEDDPRVDLVRQLLEYERFKEAAGELEARPQLYREVFPRLAEVADTKLPLDEEPLAEVSVFELMDAFRRVWERAPKESVHEIFGEKVTLRDKIHELLERLESNDSMTFEELLEPAGSRQALVITFLAILELTRLRIVRIFQVVRYGMIRVQKSVSTMPEDREAIARQLDDEAPASGEEAGEEEGEGQTADAPPAERDPEEGS
ncbi:MAG: segregation/condensation protein A, partial [Deltaproteobacteria bacterium]|nr:segregation/condensation protein A [Deltaproteobacteria bacterium]